MLTKIGLVDCLYQDDVLSSASLQITAEEANILRPQTSLQNVADSTDAIGWLLILPSVKLVYVGLWCGKASVMLVGQQHNKY